MKEKIRKRNLITAYLIFAVLFGIMYMIIMPFPASPDENRHFVKIFSVTEGYFLPMDDTYLPDGLNIPDQFELKYDKLREMSGRIADKNNPVKYDLSRTAFYFPLVYLPQTAGVAVAKNFTENIFRICLTGRIFGYIFNICMITAAMYLIPYGESIIFLTALNPIFMQQSVSLSGDSVVNALAVFLTAYLFALRGKTVKRLWPLFVLFPVLGLCKMFYLPMVLLIFLIGDKETESSKKTVFVRTGVIALSILSCVLWFYTASRNTLYIVSGDSGSNTEYIMSAPLNYFKIIGRSFISEGRTWVRQTFGGNLGWIAVNVFMPFILIYLLLFIYTALCENGDLKPKDRALIILVDIIIVFIVLTTEYVQWTPYKGQIIEGVQGRYFLPVLPVSFVCLTGKDPKLPKKHLNKIIYAYTAFYNIAALVTVYAAFS